MSVSGAAALVVAGALAVAGIPKLARHDHTAAGFDRLGLPQPAALAWAVPAVEVAVAALLVVFPGWGGVVAFALLAGFTVYLVGLVRSGRQVSCGCFGSSGHRAVSVLDVARNALLLTAAAAAATHEGPLRPDGWTVVAAVAAGTGGAVVLGWSARRLLEPAADAR